MKTPQRSSAGPAAGSLLHAGSSGGGGGGDSGGASPHSRVTSHRYARHPDAAAAMPQAASRRAVKGWKGNDRDLMMDTFKIDRDTGRERSPSGEERRRG